MTGLASRKTHFDYGLRVALRTWEGERRQNAQILQPNDYLSPARVTIATPEGPHASCSCCRIAISFSPSSAPRTLLPHDPTPPRTFCLELENLENLYRLFCLEFK
jgi:hypothetical protein